MKRVLTVKDIQEILGICEKTAYGLVRQALTREDMFKVIKVGNLYRIPTKPFLDWIDGVEN